METKIGCYICKGCDIAASIETDKLVELATGEGKAALAKEHDCLCSPEGVELIRNDIAAEGLNRITVAACSQRVFPELFDFGNEVITDRVSLREWVAWAHEPNDEDTQMLAEDYIRMSCAKLEVVEPAEPHIEETSREIMIVGGGVTGMTSALAAADAGYPVHLVEKADKLGGWATKFAKVFPKTPPYHDLQDSGYEQLIEKVNAHDKITVHLSSVIKRTKGQPGQFAVTLNEGGSETSLNIGSIIQATGWRPYEAEKLTHLGYGATPDVVTNIQVEEMVKNGGIKKPSDGSAPKSICFIQCAGSRDEDHLPYCSAVCCRVSLKQAMYVREQLPDTKVYVVYKDIRSPGQYELFYAHAQNDDGIFLTKGEIASVARTNGNITVGVTDTILGEDIAIEADMVVLATGMVPTTKAKGQVGYLDLVEELLEGEQAPEEEPAEDEGATEDGKKEASGAEKGAKILNLAYRQGTDLPTLKYGFPDSHYICFPYETRRTGIYAAGPVRSPMDMATAATDAHGAALKAIQSVEAVARGVAVHPRSGDMSFPDFALQRCTQCKRCTEDCPFGTLDEDDKGTPQPNPFRCRRCGVCMGACPERIINFKDYSVRSISQMVKAIDIPDEFDEKPRILCFICENDALPSIDMAGLARLKYNAMIRIIPLRCLGSMNTIWVGDALASGFDGVMLIGCKKGKDYQCHFVRGSELAYYRMENVQEKLKQLVLEEERVELHELAITDFHKVPQIFDDFLETIEGIGFNPYKGM